MATLPRNWDQTAPERRLPPEAQAREAMLAAGIGVEEAPDVVLDGKPHRFRVAGDKGREKSGWYVLFGDNLPAGRFGNWRGDLSVAWHATPDHVLTPAERELIELSYERARLMHEAEAKKKHEQAAAACSEIWEKAAAADSANGYLVRKQVKSHGLRQTGDGRLIMPIYVGERLASLQYISADGRKEFHAGGEVSCGYFFIPPTGAAAKTVYVVEGYATGASVHEATGAGVVVALNAGNLSKVGQFLRGKMPQARIVFVADNDKSGVGQEKARAAAGLIGAQVIVPPEIGDANDYAVAGHDLKALLDAEPDPWLVPLSEFCQKPQPIKWLIKGWVQEEALMMVFGASGTGKTFVVLDQALSIACPQINDWQGCRVKHGPVVYLAGEGHIGLKARIAGWMSHKGANSAEMLISTSAENLNTPEGVGRVIAEIGRYETKPVLIVVDTLNRFLFGDENTAKDTKTFLDACTRLMNEFRCSVLIVHHTGVAQEAQNRARGSSAWKGAMDLETWVNKEPGNVKVLVRQTKSKDAELQPDLWLEQVQIAVPGWTDEDGSPVTTVVMERSDSGDEPKEKKLTKSQQFGLQTFREAAERFGRLDAEGNFAGLELEKWREYFYQCSPSENDSTKRCAFNRAKADLCEIGRLRVENGFYFLKGFAAELEQKQIAKILYKQRCKI